MNDLIAFIREEIGEYKLPMAAETLIEDDLGVSGDEAIDLIIKFGKTFKVDISRFKPDQYFYPEPSIFSQNKPVKPLTIGHLEKAIQAGRLDEDVINE